MFSDAKVAKIVQTGIYFFIFIIVVLYIMYSYSVLAKRTCQIGLNALFYVKNCNILVLFVIFSVHKGKNIILFHF